MQGFQKLGYCLVVLLSLLGCESETTSPTQESCGDPTDRIISVSFTLDGRHYDLNSFESLFGANVYDASGDTTFVDYHRETSTNYYQLKLAWPGDDTVGTFAWQNSAKYLEGYGCFITVDSLLDTRRYFPASGTTSIATYGDTLFGTFCGELKDSLGGKHELRNGRFYFVIN